MRGPTPTFFTRCSNGGPLRISFRFIVKWSGKNRLPHWICQRTENFPRSRKIGVRNEIHQCVQLPAFFSLAQFPHILIMRSAVLVLPIRPKVRAP